YSTTDRFAARCGRPSPYASSASPSSRGRSNGSDPGGASATCGGSWPPAPRRPGPRPETGGWGLFFAAGPINPHVKVRLFIGGRRVVPDFRWPDQRLVVEADSRAWHDHKLAREDDAERQALLEAYGDRVVRVTWEQAIARPAQSLDRIIAA